MEIYALLWAISNTCNDCIFNKMEDPNFFLGYLQSYQLDSCVVVTLQGGGASADGLSVQPMRDGRSGFVQPIWLVA